MKRNVKGENETSETVIAKDQQSLFENVNAAQTAADSATINDNLRQSFGAGGGVAGVQDLGTDFTVAEELHRRTATPGDPLNSNANFENPNIHSQGNVG